MESTHTDRGQPRADLNQVSPLDHHQTAVTFNCFILKMTEVLNNFGNRMEDVLDRAEETLGTADQKLRLMEAKLAAVKVDKENSETLQKPKASSESVLAAKMEAEEASTSQPVEVTTASSSDKNKAIGTSDASVVLIKNDPAYSKYFKMLKMGVPEVGVIQKMETEGVDSSILKRGDEPSRPKDNTMSGYGSSGESVSSFSDSD